MFVGYQSQVLQDYQKKKLAGTLSLKLINPTPAKLKAECLAVLDTRYVPKDEKMLKEFFGARENVASYAHAMKKHDTDKFRPLVSFLKGTVTVPEDKNIELLAWLIDFEPRPYKFDPSSAGSKIIAEREIIVEENDIAEKAGEITMGEGPDEIVDPGLDEPKKEDGDGKNIENEEEQLLMEENMPTRKAAPLWKTRSTVIIFLMIAVASVATYLMAIRDERCMCWAGDRYLMVSCNKKMRETPVFALDTTLLLHFKKITKPDTITLRSVGKIWYSKINNSVEFYTTHGYHPIHIERRLKPASQLIIKEYVLNK